MNAQDLPPPAALFGTLPGTTSAAPTPALAPEPPPPAAFSEADLIQRLKAQAVLAVMGGLTAESGHYINDQALGLGNQVAAALFVEVVATLPNIPAQVRDLYETAFFQAAEKIIGKNGLRQSMNRLISVGQAKGACLLLAEETVKMFTGIDSLLQQATHGPVSYQQQQAQRQALGQPVQESPQDALYRNLGLKK
jgi:hypothetical protein